MGSDPRVASTQTLVAALQGLGRDENTRNQCIALLMDFEKKHSAAANIRESVTGPICDALFSETDELEVVLENGLHINFLYRTKIARDIVLRAVDRPSHLWEPQTTKLLLTLVTQTQGDVLIGGAYFGDHAIVLAHKIGATRRVHAFEPNSDQIAILQKNIAKNRLTNVSTHQKVLWSASGLKFKFDGYDSFASVVQAQNNDGFDSVTLDDYWPSDRRLGLVHIDVEGAELEILKGGAQQIQRDRPFVVFEIHRSYVNWDAGIEKTDIARFFLDMGYSLYAVRDINSHLEMTSPVELIPAKDVYLEGPPHGFNMLAIPAGASPESLQCRVVVGSSPKLLRHKDPALHHPSDGSWA